jgi:urease accessory protein
MPQLGHGGGMVAGDVTRVRCEVNTGATVVLTTQASTKVFHCRRGGCVRQEVRATVAAGALLAVIADPVVPYEDSRFLQRQTFRLDKGLTATDGLSQNEGGSLVLVDWYTSGRRGRGEQWRFRHYESINDVYVGDSLLVHDAVCTHLNRMIHHPEKSRCQAFTA